MNHKINQWTKSAVLLGAILATSLSACAPTLTNQSGSTQVVELKAVAVTEVDAGGASSPSVGLSWSGLSSEANSVTLFRRESDQGAAEAQNVAVLKVTNDTTHTDKKETLEEDKSYLYNMRVDAATKNRLAAGESHSVKISNASMAKAFSLKVPSEDGREIPDLGFGIEFMWNDAGASLYHVSVKSMENVIQWAAFTSKTKFNYASVSEVSVPNSLKSYFPLSSTSPNAGQNEVLFNNLKSGAYKIEVKAVFTNGASLANATSIVVRSSGERSFKVNL